MPLPFPGMNPYLEIEKRYMAIKSYCTSGDAGDAAAAGFLAGAGGRVK
jgi:hypothetical protein